MAFAISIDLVYLDKICSMKNFPKSFALLQEMTMKLFHIRRCIFKYVDEEGEFVTISSDQELNDIYSLLTDMKINNFTVVIENDCMSGVYRRENVEKVKEEIIWKDVRCGICDEFPIAGIRFKCTICEDLNVCEFCEMTCEHEHPFIKFTSKDHYIRLLESTYIILDKATSIFEKKPLVHN